MHHTLKRFFACSLITMLVAPLFAHDTWLVPHRFRVAPGETVTLDLTSGMEFPKLDAAPKPERIGAIACRLAGRTFDVTDRAAAPNSLQIKAALPEAGIAALWIKGTPRQIELKADEVAHYLDEIAAPAALRQQWAEMKPQRWRESYIKHVKTFVAVGDTKNDTSWREPVGSALEIVPEKDPTILRVDHNFPVQVLRNGAPAAEFSLGIVAAGESKGQMRKTDAQGRVTFQLTRPGQWLLRGTDLRKSTKQDIDWESDFATLTIEVAAR